MASQPTDWHYIWLSMKSVVEFLYFLAGIVLVGAAVYAARQVKFASQQVKLASDQLTIASQQLDSTREIAKSAARRESVKLAGEKCEYFADHVVPAQNDTLNAYMAAHCTFLDPVPLQQGAAPLPPFTIINGDFAQPMNYDIRRITPEQWESVKAHMVMFLNRMETFAIPFAAGVADDATGFQETAPVFIGTMNTFLPAVYFLRTTQGARYASILRLFSVWNNRVIANALAQAIPGMQQMVADAAANQIQPL